MRYSFRMAAAALAGLSIGSFSFAQDNGKPWSMAEEYYGEAEMDASRAQLQHSHGAMNAAFVQAERFELQAFEDEQGLLLDANAWYGGDLNKIWIKSELEYLPDDGAFEEAEIQALWSRAISPYFDFQAGLRQDFEPAGHTHLVAGFQGLAPYLFELDAAFFLSSDGDLTARIEAEYELLLTQRFILQPRVELELSAQEISDLKTGSGVTGFDAGLRLRYEVRREFAPYIGIEWQKSFGGTADFARAAGGETEATAFLVGLRMWY